MNNDICKSIIERKVLGFRYKGVDRTVEPHCYGVQINGKPGLCAWQVDGGSGEGFRLFVVDEMGVAHIGRSFDGPRPGYRRGDSRFGTIYAEL